MTATITATNGAGSTSPELILSPVEAGNESRNILHDLTGGGIAVSFVDPRPRAGSLLLLYADEAAAEAARKLHLQPTPFTLSWPERPSLNGLSYFVFGGSPRLTHDAAATRTKWTLDIPYQELSP